MCGFKLVYQPPPATVLGGQQVVLGFALFKVDRVNVAAGPFKWAVPWNQVLNFAINPLGVPDRSALLPALRTEGAIQVEFLRVVCADHEMRTAIDAEVLELKVGHACCIQNLQHEQSAEAFQP